MPITFAPGRAIMARRVQFGVTCEPFDKLNQYQKQVHFRHALEAGSKTLLFYSRTDAGQVVLTLTDTV